MSAWKNITNGSLAYYPKGHHHAVMTVAAKEVFTLSDDLDYIIGTQIAREQVKRVDLRTAVTVIEEPDPPPADSEPEPEPSAVEGDAPDSNWRASLSRSKKAG